jgi:hypothetical protein
MRITAAKLTVALCAALLAGGCGGATAASSSHTAKPTTTITQRVMTAEQITAAIQAQGFEPKAKVTDYTADTDPNHLLGRQGGYTSKTEWLESDGSFDSIEVYPTTAGATERMAMLESIAGGLIGDGYDYQQGPVVLRLSKILTPLRAGIAFADVINALNVKGT